MCRSHTRHNTCVGNARCVTWIRRLHSGGHSYSPWVVRKALSTLGIISDLRPSPQGCETFGHHASWRPAAVQGPGEAPLCIILNVVVSCCAAWCSPSEHMVVIPGIQRRIVVNARRTTTQLLFWARLRLLRFCSCVGRGVPFIININTW